MATKKSTIFILPYPIQGHINPMLQFAKRLATKSHNFNLTLLLPASKTKSVTPRIGSINIRYISDGVKEGQVFDTSMNYYNLFERNVPISLEELIRLERGDDRVKPVILIYDSFLPWALDVAHRNGLSAAPFFTQTCSVSSVYLLYKKGELNDPAAEAIHGLPMLAERDLPSFIPNKESSPDLLNLLVDQFSNLDEADYVFFNTFDKLEPQMVEWMARQWPVLTIGPTLPSMYLDKCIDDDKSYGLSLFEPNRTTCDDWLSEREDSSVIYVSFGSMAVLKQEQMNEIVTSLENLQKHFIWVVRETEMTKLPSSFVEWCLSSGLGLVVTWCNQLDVLAHKAIGCFVTHCGWNSTLEALCFGVAMVAMPTWSDQPTNAKFVEDVWGVGVRAKEDENGIVKGLELERCVRVVLEEGQQCNEIRRKAEEVKKWALEAIKIGGSSDCNIDKFVSELESF